MSEAKHFIRMLQRAPRADVAILLITFVLTVFADLVVAVNIGVILAMLSFMRRMASSVEVRQSTAEELAQEAHGSDSHLLPEGVQVFAVEGPFFFGAVENFERALAATNNDPTLLIIRLKWVPFIDITGLQALEETILDLQRRGVTVFLSGANARVYGKLERAGILALVGSTGYYNDFHAALNAAKARSGSPSP